MQTTHVLRERDALVVPDIIGPRLPHREELETEENRETFGMIALILYFPFHNEKGILQGEKSYWKAFLKCEKDGGLTRQGTEYLQNLQEYYISKRAASM